MAQSDAAASPPTSSDAPNASASSSSSSSSAGSGASPRGGPFGSSPRGGRAEATPFPPASPRGSPGGGAAPGAQRWGQQGGGGGLRGGGGSRGDSMDWGRLREGVAIPLPGPQSARQDGGGGGSGGRGGYGAAAQGEALDPPLLTARLKEARSLDELHELVRLHAQSMGAVHDAVVCSGCGRLGMGAGSNPRVRSAATALFIEAAQSWLGRDSATFGRGGRSIANILHAAAKLHILRREAVLQSLFREAVRLSRDMKAQEAASCLYSVAMLGLTSAALARPLAIACVELVRDMNAQDVVNSLWALATIGITDLSLARPLAIACVELARNMSAQSASNCLWALAAVHIDDESIVRPIAVAGVELVGGMHAQSASSCLWALASIGLNDASLSRPFAAACAERISDITTAQGAAQCLWALGALGISDAALVQPIAIACVELIGGCSPSQLANALWSLSLLGVSDVTIVRPLAFAAVDAVRALKAHEAANVLWAFATLGSLPAELVRPVVSSCFELAHEMTGRDAAKSLWAIAALGLSVLVDEAAMRPLVQAVDRADRAGGLSEPEAREVLLAHFAGLACDASLLQRLWEPVRAGAGAGAGLEAAGGQHHEVAAALARIGLDSQLGQHALDGLLEISIIARSVNAAAAPGFVAVELDGPARFLLPAFDAPEGMEAGPISGATRLRHTLLRRHNSGFAGLVAIPFFEWAGERGDDAREEAYLAEKLRGEGLARMVSPSPPR